MLLKNRHQGGEDGTYDKKKCPEQREHTEPV
jgi:hypothetical protein